MFNPLIAQGTPSAGDRVAPQRNARRLRGSLAVSAVVIASALAGSASASATPLPTGPQPPTTVQPASGAAAQGIIMRDGGICDPIRHMGC